MEEKKITILKDGPYEVTGGVPLNEMRIVPNERGESAAWMKTREYPLQESYHLCRCGHSKNKPFCDGTHAKIHFDGTETAENIPYDESCEIYEGDGMTLMDKRELCAFARFCDPNGQVWGLIEDRKNVDLAVEEACNCPAGRLTVVIDGEKAEAELPQEISLIDDHPKGKRGPIWVRGGIPVIGSDGTRYEVRNRVTLCRCGQSRNKPFCDASHMTDPESDED
ncbi:CDGSH iron-sulfur domain-containing protein [Cloacibacillus porcorum]|uniref:CDGSH iron-sulfur domain-containing protein n=1 Tax=Cloacibacillus porcorum TaxID=1197717 RepID=UPI0023F4CF9E|nr:CDGSH iron-sulfur domain-containing protein [Cloacibacillus porcorum]MDD7648936.1 CDGSH iron-sulfur domain-containing protein [Cloacibacillus porcorum]MDY4094287.1 CDGSH iron-sulfur domain-containing protein [Cloacibacillus porcorum]